MSKFIVRYTINNVNFENTFREEQSALQLAVYIYEKYNVDVQVTKLVEKLVMGFSMRKIVTITRPF